MKRRDFISSVTVAGVIPFFPAQAVEKSPSLLSVLEERRPKWTVTHQDKAGRVTMIDKFYGESR
tara:strand:+ start:336 stop:527 length:192 start_codon:yes stop_codon:yes gene_type:complete